MAAIPRRPLQMQQRNEENFVEKSSKNISSRAGTRTALSNISNIQRRPNIGTKVKKDAVLDKAPVNKAFTRVKSQTNLQKPRTKPTKIEPVHVLEEEPLGIEDIDENDLKNPTLCAEYVKDIYRHMRKAERRLQTGDYMSKQSEINVKMRSILIDWLIQVQSRFNLLQETLYLTVYIIDRFLDKHDVIRSELQLVGVTAMLLASKYEEMFAPEIGDFVYITDNAYSKIKIRSMEQKILRAIEYDFSNPVCLNFLRRNSKAGAVDAQKHTLAKYLMELTLIDYNLARKLPSEIAAAALYLSISLIDESEWTPTLQHYSGYSEEQILPTVTEMAALVLTVDTSRYQAVKTKYSATKFLKISRLPELKGPLIKHYAGN
ncbi:G2/mitotic-specific cyclin-B-like [Hydractinia symbiolongicarpus]|uniref:G2/mitotic-specific cyclin-B-like n=1 Tax=Hydractinia symbiolongicarpus TaxID=13093 RepID=UPI00254C6FDE|nr:G2/mitotic-specific cyclin-B-like [Hydractinia symbiolongicarpus]